MIRRWKVRLIEKHCPKDRNNLRLTVSDGVLLQQICHVYVHNTSFLYHQVVAVRDLTASGSTCGHTKIISGHSYPLLELPLWRASLSILTQHENNRNFRSVELDVAVAVRKHASIISVCFVTIICFPDLSFFCTVFKILIIGIFVWNIARD